MPMLGGSGAAPMAMFRQAVSRPTMSARVAPAVMRIAHGNNFGTAGLNCRLSVLPVRVDAVSGSAVAAGHGPEQGQALIVSVCRLNLLAVADAARSGFRLSGGRDQGGYENGGQNGAQGFIL
jgi:hypothetical protein